MSNNPLPTSRVQSGYRKGEETRARILSVALEEFGTNGYATATTRQIVEKAGVNLPALTYYFGGKEGLYLACAQDIVVRYRDGVGAVANVAIHALAAPLPAGEATALLKRLMSALARFLLSSGEATHRTVFVQREIASPGPAFEILYSQLWQPGIDLAAALISRVLGDGADEQQVRLRAVMMISSLTGLVEGRDIIARAISDDDKVEAVITILEKQIDDLTGS